jgi:hypothetical protein
MGLTDAQLLTDIGNIITDLDDSNAVETATLTPADGSTTSTFSIVRAKTLSERELLQVGWASKYQISVYAVRGEDASSASIGDILNLGTEGELRILNVSRGPARAYFRFDLGDKYSGTL